MELYDFELSSFLEKNLTHVYFIKSYDELSNFVIPKYPCAFIFNYHPRSKRIGHWSCAYFFNIGNSSYLCLYGVTPYGEIAKFLKKSSIHTIYNKKIIQNFDSPYCGHHVLRFLIKTAKGTTLSQYVNSFSNNLLKNDEICLQFYLKHK